MVHPRVCVFVQACVFVRASCSLCFGTLRLASSASSSLCSRRFSLLTSAACAFRSASLLFCSPCRGARVTKPCSHHVTIAVNPALRSRAAQQGRARIHAVYAPSQPDSTSSATTIRCLSSSRTSRSCDTAAARASAGAAAAAATAAAGGGGGKTCTGLSFRAWGEKREGGGLGGCGRRVSGIHEPSWQARDACYGACTSQS